MLTWGKDNHGEGLSGYIITEARGPFARARPSIARITPETFASCRPGLLGIETQCWIVRGGMPLSVLAILDRPLHNCRTGTPKLLDVPVP